MIDITGRSQKNCPRMLLTRQFASNVTDDHAVNAIYDSPIWYALFIKKSEDGVAVMVLFEREKLGAYDGTAKKSDAVSKSLICHLDFASWTCSHLSCITVTLFSVSNRILCRPELSTNSLIYSVFCLDCLLMYLYMLCNICFLSTDSN